MINANDKKSRTRRYLDLLNVTKKSLTYDQRAASFLNGYLSADPAQIILAQKIAEKLETYSSLSVW